MEKRKKLLFLAAAIIILSGVVLFSVRARRGETVLVQTSQVELKEELIAKVSASGEIKPKEYVELQAEIAGVVVELYVREGDVVQKDNLLLRIDPVQSETESRAQKALLEVAQAEAANQKAQISLQETNLERERANVRVAQAELDRARSSMELARSSFERRQQLFEDNLIPRETYDSARNELIAAETAVTASQARLEQARAQLAVAEMVLQQTRTSHRSALSRVEQNRAILERTLDLLSKTVIRSPLTGVITRLHVEVGERAVPGTLNNPAATLMEIANLSVIQAEIQVDESDIVNVRLGQPAEVKVDALPKRPLKGVVTEVGNAAIQRPGSTQQEAREFKVVVQLEEPPEQLRPGLSCTAEITTDTRENIISIPIQALTMREFEVDENGNRLAPDARDRRRSAADGARDGRLEKKQFQGVFVVSDGKAEFVPVETGITGDTDIEIVSGLAPGATIITGSFRTLRTLKEGDLLKIERQDRN